MDLGTSTAIVRLCWHRGAACFVLGLHQMNSPATARARQPALRGGHGSRRRRDARCSSPTGGGIRRPAGSIIVVGIVIGGGAGLYTARTVKMTAMPQLVSLFNAVGGGAAALVAIDDFVRLATAATHAPGPTTSPRSSTSSSAP